MGYIHDTGVCAFLPPELTQVNDGTGASWTTATSSSTWWLQRTAAAGIFTLKASILAAMKNVNPYKGTYLTSIDVWYRIVTMQLTAMQAYVTQLALPETGYAWSAPAEKTFLMDTAHDTEAERAAVGYHKMRLTMYPAFWIEYDYTINLELTCTGGADSIFNYYGSRVNYTLRV
jgi:hypothetical protein